MMGGMMCGCQIVYSSWTSDKELFQRDERPCVQIHNRRKLERHLNCEINFNKPTSKTKGQLAKRQSGFFILAEHLELLELELNNE